MELAVHDHLTINKTYADRYEKKKRREELFKLRDKYGPDVDLSEESSSSEEEDEMAQEVTPYKTKEFLRVLSLVKHRDTKIYNENFKFFQEESSNASDGKDNVSRDKICKNKPMFLKDYERKQLLEEGSRAGLSDEDDDKGERRPLSYVEEQQQLKDSFKQALFEDASDESGDEFLSVRQKTDQEKEEEEVTYIKWLKGHELKMKGQEIVDMDALRRYWTDPRLHPDEAFLRDYMLNEGWKDKGAGRIPSYEEVVGEGPSISDDEEEIEQQDSFERQYNFRFEEPNSALIASYPRTLSGSVRLQDDRRKLKRKAREEKKTKEHEQKKEELRRLKNLKRQEIQEKLRKLQELTGNTVVGFTEEELEGEFDPHSYDASMSRIFDEGYYEEEQEGAEKPVFSDSEEEEFVENLEDWVAEEEPHCEDPDFNMDADYDPASAPKVPPQSQRCKKRKSHFSQMVHRQKPLFEPSEKSFEEYFDEYYKVDYEDLVADIPCRFKYRQTVPNDFGLSTEEVLISDNTELNRWATLMKTVQFRSEEEEKKDVVSYKKKSKNFQKKLQVLSTLNKLLEKEGDMDNDNPKNKPKAKKSKRRVAAEPTPTSCTGSTKRKKSADDVVKKRGKTRDRSKESSPQHEVRTRRRKRTLAKDLTSPARANNRKRTEDTTDDILHHAAKAVDSSQGLSSSRLASYGLATKKTRKRKGF